MSDLIFPNLVGLAWEGRQRSPEFKTLMQTSVSGLDTPISLWVFPRYTWALPYDVLRSSDPYAEYQALLGIFLISSGSAGSFLFNDWEDNQVAGQYIGTGDGITTQFQLVRTLGAFTEPVLKENVVSAVYVAGVQQGDVGTTIGGEEVTVGGQEATLFQGIRWTVSQAVISFATPPAQGAAITADFSYYWRCRFTEDTVDADALYYKFWQMKKVEIRSIKLGSG